MNLTHLDLERLHVTSADLDNLFGTQRVAQAARVFYPFEPQPNYDRTNGSYVGMSWMTVCQIYKRCYDTCPPYPLFQSYEEGTLCSRTDNAPFWIRDMLAYRQVRINQRRYGRKIYALRTWLHRQVARVLSWLYGWTDYIFLREFPPNMRHLWNRPHIIESPLRERRYPPPL